VTPRKPSGSLGKGGDATSVVDYPTTVHAGRSNVTGLRANFVVSTAQEGHGAKENPRGILAK